LDTKNIARIAEQKKINLSEEELQFFLEKKRQIHITEADAMMVLGIPCWYP
jgi:hypothetical protein